MLMTSVCNAYRALSRPVDGLRGRPDNVHTFSTTDVPRSPIGRSKRIAINSPKT
jgi:hypothetical protein